MNIYHRIYKLHQRKITPQQIASTTKMPIKLVRSVLQRFDPKKSEAEIEKEALATESYLDYNISKQHKYGTLDISGFLYEKFGDKIKKSIKQFLLKTTSGLLAVKMDEVYDVDDEGMNIIISEFKSIINNGRIVVILAPSDSVDEYIIANDVENTIKVFGTISAFEEYVYRVSHGDQ
jgi:hypothetical protein